MKAEHRKELESNVLVHQLEKAYAGLKQGPSRTTVIWVVGAVAILLVYLLFRYFMSTSEATTSARWLKLDDVVFPEQLEMVVNENDLKDTPQGRLARYKEARVNLAEGLRVLGSNTSEGVEKVEKATKTYEELAQSPGKIPLLHQEALWAAAKGNETLGEFDKATELYKKLANEYPTSALGKDAKKQLERLENADKKDLAELKKAFSAAKTSKSE